MQQIIQKLSLITSQAQETDEQRAERLSESATDAGCDPETLYAVEQDLRGFARHMNDQHSDTVRELENRLQAFAPMLGVPPETAQDLGPDTAIKLGGQIATARPTHTALLVKTLHESFQRQGLYDELGTETPPEGALAPTLAVEHEEDEDA